MMPRWLASVALFLHLLLLLLPVVESASVRGGGDGDRDDVFDHDALSDKVSSLNILGAAVVYYDSARGMDGPVVHGYGRISSSPSSEPVTPDTTFMLASISKVFAASAVAVLVDKGIINLDDDICDVLPLEWDKTTSCRNPNYPNDVVTWRMILTHRSSLTGDVPDARDRNGHRVSPGYGPDGGYTSESPAAGNPSCPLDDTVGFYRDLLVDKPTETSVGSDLTLQGGKELNWFRLMQSKGGAWKNYRPGSRRGYSNLAYGYLAALVELASGETFPAFCKEYLFDKLSMDNTAWFRRDLSPGTREAVPVEYRRGGRQRQRFVDVGHYCFVDYASGELRTSARDVAKWADAMLRYGAPTTLWSDEVGRQVLRQGRKYVPYRGRTRRRVSQSLQGVLTVDIQEHGYKLVS